VGGEGNIIGTNTSGLLSVYLQTNQQIPNDRTLFASSISKYVLLSSTQFLNFDSTASLTSSLPNSNFSITALPFAPAFTFARYMSPVPIISSISPTSGPVRGGTFVTISGANLGVNPADAVNGQPLINLGPVSAWRPWCSSIEWKSSSKIVCITAPITIGDLSIPSGWVNQLQNVVIRTASSGMFLSNAVQFRYNQVPQIVSLTDGVGNALVAGSVNGGSSVHIKGVVCNFVLLFTHHFKHLLVYKISI
jgi:hypothetical protein